MSARRRKIWWRRSSWGRREEMHGGDKWADERGVRAEQEQRERERVVQPSERPTDQINGSVS